MFLDEKKLKIDGADSLQHYYHNFYSEPEEFPKRTQGCRSAMVWNEVKFNGAIDYVSIDGKVD